MITDPEAIRFSNEVIRPTAEKVRALVAEIQANTTVWFGGMNTKIPNTSSVLDDGRTAEGISALTGADINSVMGILIGMAASTNAEIISKPCVRPLAAH